MIQSFRCRDTERLFNDESVARYRAVERAARHLGDPLVPPGNRLEKLKAGRAGRCSGRIDGSGGSRSGGGMAMRSN